MTYYSFRFTIDNKAQAGIPAVFSFDFSPATNSTLSLYKILVAQASYPDLQTDDYKEVVVDASKLGFSFSLGNFLRRSQQYIEILVAAGDSKPISGALNATVSYMTSSAVLSIGGDAVYIASLTIPEEGEGYDNNANSYFLGKGYSVDHGEEAAVAVTASVLGGLGAALTLLVCYCRRKNSQEQNIKFGVGRHEVKG